MRFFQNPQCAVSKLLFLSAALDYDAIRYGLVEEIELTATNYGLIEAETSL